jgi:hypothetical protein
VRERLRKMRESAEAVKSGYHPFVVAEILVECKISHSQ